MRVAIVYTGITSYMTDCWRELAKRQGVQLRIWIEDTKTYRFKGDRDRALRNLSCKWDYSENLTEEKLACFEDEIIAFKPDIVFVCGWSQKLPPYISSSKRLAHIPMVLEMDMPWEWRFRKFAAKFLLWKRLRRFSAVFVPGKCSARYARWLGFSKDRIYEGRNCIDIDKFVNIDPVYRESRSGFLFIGRRSREKGLDVLERAYNEYKSLGGTWKLDIPDYVEPEDVPRVMSEHICLIVPSKWEPWGVVVLEAIAAGMRVIVSNRVCSKYDLPVDAIFAASNVKSLSRAMIAFEKGFTERKDENDKKALLQVQKKYGVIKWSDRVMKICCDVINGK